MEANKLTMGSLFDGSGGFPLAGLLTEQIIPVWASEVEPFAIKVTTKNLPMMKHYGDISKLNGATLPPVDIITFGSPCQDMSVAGRRSGLDGSRSNLFFEAIRIIKEMRGHTDGKYPRFAVWENVTGAFSSNQGQDFKAVLNSFCKIKNTSYHVPEPPTPKQGRRWKPAGSIMGNGFSLAWRVLDAQYWGVPQRRKRIFLVADFADQCASKILFESESMSRYSAESFRTWQRTAADAEICTGTAVCCRFDGYNGCLTGNVSSTLGENYGLSAGGNGVVSPNNQGQHTDRYFQVQKLGHQSCVLESSGFCPEVSAHTKSIGYEEERSPTLRTTTVPAVVIKTDKEVQHNIFMFDNHFQDARYNGPLNISPTIAARYGTGGDNMPIVLIETKAFGVCAKNSNCMKSDNPHSGFYEAHTSRCLDANGGNPNCNQGGICIVESIAFAQNQRDEVRNLHDKSGTLAARPGIKQQTFVLQGNMIGRENKNGPQGNGINEDVCFTLNTTDRHAVAFCEEDSKDPENAKDKNASDYIVRRLTPTECARLQGFPDWWCKDLEIEQPTENDITFWREVFETHRKLVTKAKRQKTDKQIVKWLNNPYSDSAEYKLWGNGVALPCVYFVLSGIVWATID